MSRHMLANPVLARAATTPRVIVDSACFENRSSQRLNKNILIDRLATRLQIAANEHTRFVDREHADMIEKERAFKHGGIADIGTGGLTQAVAGADYRLTGRIALLDARAPFGARRPERRLRRRHMQPCYHRSTDGSASSPARPAGAGDVAGAGRVRKTAREARPRSTTSREGKMFRYLNVLLAIVALGALPGLSGCLGGGGGSAAAPMRAPEPAPQPMAEPAADPDPEPMAEPAADPDPKPMAEPAADPGRADFRHLFAHYQADSPSIPDLIRADDRIIETRDAGNPYRQAIRASAGFDSGSVHGDMGWTTIQGREVTPPGRTERWMQKLSPLSDGSGVRVEVGTVAGAPNFETDSPRYTHRPIWAFESRGGRMSQVSTDKAEELIAHVEWDGGDDGNWTTWGWWLRARGPDFIESAPGDIDSSYYAAVFAGGPEFENDFAPPSLPETGVGRYRGTARGLFSSVVGAGGDGWNSGRGFGASGLFKGEFTASVDLEMNYSDSLSGTVDPEATYPRMTADMRVNRMEGAWRGLEDSPSEASYVVQEFGASDGPGWQLTAVVFDESDYVNFRHMRRGTIPYYHDGAPRDDRPGATWISGIPDSHLAGLVTRGGLSGRLSGVLTSDGHPRSVMGLFSLTARTGGLPGVRSVGADSAHTVVQSHYFAGAFLAPLAE